MSETLLSGINHVALAAADVDATVKFYCDAFGLDSTDFSTDEERSVLMFLPNGSFVQVVSAGPGPVIDAPLRAVPGNLIRDGAPIDHISLFASDVASLEAIRDRVAALGATDSEIIDTAGVALTLRFVDPDGRRLEVTAYPSQ